MTRCLFFDTETAGLPKSYKVPMEKLDNWPRVVQLAWMLCDGGFDKTLEEGSVIVKPDGFEIPKASSDLHGITTERALKEGKPLAEVLSKFDEVLGITELLVAHNLKFDRNVMGSEFLRCGMSTENLVSKDTFCTMLDTVNICRLPRKGYKGFKYPKLNELYEFLFKRRMWGGHDALADTQACAKCFFEIVKE